MTTLPPLEVTAASEDQIFFEEPDNLLHEICPFNKPDLDKLTRDRVRLMTFDKRFSFWIQQIRKGKINRTGNIGFLLPAWLYKILLKTAKS